MPVRSIPLHYVTTAEHVQQALRIKAAQGVVLTSWLSPQPEWIAVYLAPEQGVTAYCSLPPSASELAILSQAFPVIPRLHQRATHVYHSAAAIREALYHPETAPFPQVSGSAVHEIPVGPVHAGIIEPGHFRFAVVGEQVLKLSIRLGYAHKGVHGLLQNTSVQTAERLAARISGDSTVAFSCAFAQAYEHAHDITLSPATERYRAILLERERLTQHIGTVSELVNDTSLISIAAQFAILKETLLRQTQHYTGHRYAMDAIQAGQERSLRPEHAEQMRQELQILEPELIALQRLCQSHGGLQDRVVNSGILTPEQARQLGIVGIVAKACGIDHDLRRLAPSPLYRDHRPALEPITTGDVAARLQVRLSECLDSINHLHHLLKTPIIEPQAVTQAVTQTSTLGIGCVEGARGPVVVVLSTRGDVIEWAHCHDPSWQNWPALEWAVLGNIVADFPLINKSFNLSYSGVDG